MNPVADSADSLDLIIKTKKRIRIFRNRSDFRKNHNERNFKKSNYEKIVEDFTVFLIGLVKRELICCPDVGGNDLNPLM